MSESTGTQVDYAEAVPSPPSTCSECQRPLPGFYYDVNAQAVCEGCRYELESRFNSGSSGARFLRAAGLGLLAAIMGAVVYYGITALTGYEFGLIAIVVGFLVGWAVHYGSNGRGGWKYQTLAVALTYLAIVSTYIPAIIGQITRESADEAAVVELLDASPDAAAASADPVTLQTRAAGLEADDAAPGLVDLIYLVAILIAIAAVAPFLAGLENAIGLVIIAIGLYQAWSMNRGSGLSISGPHTIRATQ